MPVPEFGNKLEGIDYIDRPGVYAVIENGDRRIAVIQTANGYFLPGGGIDPGETEIEALQRELVEEIGYQILLFTELGSAIEYIKASREEKYYQIQSRFYKGKLGSKIGEGKEEDHRLVWLLQEEACELLTRQSQIWAVQGMAKV